MENSIYALQSVALAIKGTILPLIQHPMIWGFAIGFGASTMIHLFLMSDNPRQLPTMISNNVTTSFDKLAPRNQEGSYSISYTEFSKQYSKVRMTFYSMVMAFFLLVVVAIVRY